MRSLVHTSVGGNQIDVRLDCLLTVRTLIVIQKQKFLGGKVEYKPTIGELRGRHIFDDARITFIFTHMSTEIFFHTKTMHSLIDVFE
jgi:hypothetical protein